jgi:hypothetical protein
MLLLIMLVTSPSPIIPLSSHLKIDPLEVAMCSSFQNYQCNYPLHARSSSVLFISVAHKIRVSNSPFYKRSSKLILMSDVLTALVLVLVDASLPMHFAFPLSLSNFH